MPINDNGDIARAVGYVAIYGAYIEDRVAELIDMVKEIIRLRENINFLSASDQAKHLHKALKSAFSNAPDYSRKNDDIEQTNKILADVEGHLKNRHVVIHSTLISKPGGDIIIRKNRRTNTEEEVSSKEIIDLANDLFELQSEINALQFPVQRLISALPKS